MDHIVIYIQRLMIFTSLGLPMLCGAVGEFAEINVAEKKLAKQSSIYNETAPAVIYYRASLAVDGNTDTDFSQNSCSCTKPGDSSPWWSVDFQALFFIIGIRIYQRMDSEKERLKGFTLVGVHADGSNERMQTPQPYLSGEIAIRLAPSRMLKEIRVHLNHSDLAEGPIITLCEVQVFAGTMCPTPPPFPRRGLYKFIPDKEGNWSYNFSLVIHCIEGYIIDGPSSARCVDTNHWNGTFGFCSVKRCNHLLPQVAHGVLSFQSGIEGNGTYNTVVSLNCIQGYKRDSFGQLRCAGDEQWQGSLGLCLVKRCDKQPPQVANGVLTFKDGLEGNVTYNTSVSLICTEGHKRDRLGQLLCADDEQWHGTLGLCLDVDECIDGDNVCMNNGHCINTQGSFSCRCYVGFTGKKCETVIPCHIPNMDSKKSIYELHPVIMGNISYTSFLTIKCKEGYHLIGTDIIWCTRTGEWDSSIGQCTVIQCSGPFILPNNSMHLYEEGIEGNLTYNSTITIRCQEGYELSGTDLIRCNEFGVWDRLFGTCHETTNKEPHMDDEGKNVILPVAVLAPICLILIATNIVTLLKLRRYPCYRRQPSEQIQTGMAIADQFGSSQNGDIELQRRKSGSEETHSQGIGPYDELQKENRENSEYDELKFKRDLTSNKGTMYENADEFAHI